MVRLWSPDRQFLGTAEVRVPRFVQRTIRHRGVQYELVNVDADGTRDYRALEPVPGVVPRTARVMDAAGNLCGTVPIPADALPASLTINDTAYTLWTARDQSGEPVYLKVDPTPEAA